MLSFRVIFCLDVKTSLVQNHSEDEFSPIRSISCKSNSFYWKTFARGLVLKQTQKGKLAYFLIFAKIEKYVEIFKDLLIKKFLVLLLVLVLKEIEKQERVSMCQKIRNRNRVIDK